MSNLQIYHFSTLQLSECKRKPDKSGGLSMGRIKSIFRHFTKFNIGKPDSPQNSTYRHESFNHFLGIPVFEFF